MHNKAWFYCGAFAIAASVSCSAQVERDTAGAGARLGGGAQQFNFRSKAVKPKPAKAGTCYGGQKCEVEITVTAGKPCTITLDHDYVIIDDRDARRVAVQWRVKTDGWSFDPAKGIEIVNPGRDFTTAQVNPADPAEYGVTFVGKRNKWYWKYNINLRDKQGTACSLDPGLITDWP
jgi:hypothetical protein